MILGIKDLNNDCSAEISFYRSILPALNKDYHQIVYDFSYIRNEDRFKHISKHDTRFIILNGQGYLFEQVSAKNLVFPLRNHLIVTQIQRSQ